jgi:hypothetical protein
MRNFFVIMSQPIRKLRDEEVKVQTLRQFLSYLLNVGRQQAGVLSITLSTYTFLICRIQSKKQRCSRKV